MNRLLVRLYVVGSIIVFLGITVFFFYDLSETRRENEQRAVAAFDTLADSIVEAWQSQTLTEASSAVVSTLEREEELQPLVLSVYSYDIGIDYLWAVDDRFIRGEIDVGASAPPVISTNDLVHTRFSRSFRLPDEQRRIVTAVYPVLDESSVYPTLRLTLILVLAFVSVVLIVAIVHAIGGSPTVPSRAKPRATSEPKSTPTAEPTATRKRTATREPSEQPEPENDLVSVEIATGDYQTTSGLVPEAGLLRRITLELERAAFQEQDLSVAIFNFNTGTRGDEEYRRNATAVLAFFSFEDLCFERGDEEIVVLFPGTTLGDALGQIERFQRYYWEERHNWDATDADFVVGVSARNGRLVEGDRVIRECGAALERARTIPGRIMGFQPDPQRYRNYLLETSS